MIIVLQDRLAFRRGAWRGDWSKKGWRFGPYGVIRTGFAAYDVAHEGDDRIIRPLNLGRFYRWISAARVAQALHIARQAGAAEVAAFGLDGVGS